MWAAEIGSNGKPGDTLRVFSTKDEAIAWVDAAFPGIECRIWCLTRKA